MVSVPFPITSFSCLEPETQYILCTTRMPVTVSACMHLHQVFLDAGDGEPRYFDGMVTGRNPGRATDMCAWMPRCWRVGRSWLECGWLLLSVAACLANGDSVVLYRDWFRWLVQRDVYERRNETECPRGTDEARPQPSTRP